MKLEVGKKYKDIDGDVWEVLTVRNGKYLAVHGDDFVKSYDESGMYIGGNCHSYDLIKEYEEPARYSVDIWVNSKPQLIKQNINFTTFLFGSLNWSSAKTQNCPRKVRITVEEVEE